MRILVLSDRVFRPNLGDGLRFSGLLGPLIGKHQFDLICYAKQDEKLDPEIRALFKDVTLIPAPQDQRAPLLRRVAKAVSALDFSRTSAAMRVAIENAISRGGYDLVFDAGGYTCPNLPRAPLSIPLVLDSVDEPMVRELRAFRHAPLSERFGHLHKAWRYWLFERRAYSRARFITYASEIDASFYQRCFPERSVAVVPNGVDSDHFAPTGLEAEYGLVVFEGNMNFGPNIDTARRLVLEILPPLLERVPEAHAAIVGRDPVPLVKELASDRVVVTGTVDDVRPYLERASVFACPMKLGSGIKNKILQAWAMKRPVVASSESLGGLAARDGENILVRDDPDSFADAVATLMRDRALASSIAAAGRETAVREYSWDTRANQLDGLFSRAVNGR